MRNELPETCFSTLPGEGKLIILKRGEKGYYPSDWETGSEKENKLIADTHNRRRGLNPAQVMAMQVGSMFGFDVPGANPQSYLDEAQQIDRRTLGWNTKLLSPDFEHKDYIMGSVYQYQVAGETISYIAPASMPESMMGIHSERILLMDLVHGKPLVPVMVKWLECDACEMTLELSSFKMKKAINAGYQIMAKVQVGPVEYALGGHDGKFPSFVTWERTPANDGDGPSNYYWGHYFDSREKAIQDFRVRAEEKFEMLSEQRRPSVKERLAEKPAVRERPVEKPRAKEER